MQLVESTESGAMFGHAHNMQIKLNFKLRRMDEILRELDGLLEI